VVLRVHDLDAMQRFYADVLGLPLLRRFGDDMAFLELPERAGNRMQAVALFVDRWPSNIPGAAWAGHDQGHSTLHHFALTVSLPNLRRAEGRWPTLAWRQRSGPFLGLAGGHSWSLIRREIPLSSLPSTTQF
jgi:catechol 2,3-dioxygenase-like lactoylglutathione lyase family enzyme